MVNTDKGNTNVQVVRTTPPPLNTTWIPTRKVLSGGIFGIIAWFLFAAISAWFHVDPSAYIQPYVNAISYYLGVSNPPSAQGGVAIALGWAFAYLVPAKYKDIARLWNNRVIAFGAADPNIPQVSLSGIIQHAQDLPAPPK